MSAPKLRLGYSFAELRCWSRHLEPRHLAAAPKRAETSQPNVNTAWAALLLLKSGKVYEHKSTTLYHIFMLLYAHMWNNSLNNYNFTHSRKNAYVHHVMGANARSCRNRMTVLEWHQLRLNLWCWCRMPPMPRSGNTPATAAQHRRHSGVETVLSPE